MRNRLPLTALCAFDAAARSGSLTTAAVEQGVTRPAISKQIKLLEQVLNCALVQSLLPQKWPFATGFTKWFACIRKRSANIWLKPASRLSVGGRRRRKAAAIEASPVQKNAT